MRLLHEICYKKAECAMFRLKTGFYENGEKSGKLLPRLLKQKEASYVIPGIKNKKGGVVTILRTSVKCFKTFIQIFIPQG